MTWIKHHRLSEQCAGQAEALLREGRAEEARERYARAAEAEERALDELAPSKAKTYGITAVSAASLYFKGRRLADAERVAMAGMRFDQLPQFARHQLRHIMQVVWTEDVRRRADLCFAPGEIIVSVDGGQVVPGGAPLVLVLEKVATVSSVWQRIAEFKSGTPHRRRGPPKKSIQDGFRPWLFHAPPGGYQFAVAIQRPNEELLQEPGDVISGFFFRVLRLVCSGSDKDFAEAVPTPEYRETFLKLARNLAPTGKVFDTLKVKAADDSNAVVLDPEVRQEIGERIRALRDEKPHPSRHNTSYEGTLCALHWDDDWLEVVAKGKRMRVHGVDEQVEDVIGPMVNKMVTVYVETDGAKHRFLDIELAE